jgi:hypothetical protein
MNIAPAIAMITFFLLRQAVSVAAEIPSSSPRRPMSATRPTSANRGASDDETAVSAYLAKAISMSTGAWP